MDSLPNGPAGPPNGPDDPPNGPDGPPNGPDGPPNGPDGLDKLARLTVIWICETSAATL